VNAHKNEQVLAGSCLRFCLEMCVCVCYVCRFYVCVGVLFGF
jgi:hypothetical protein